MTQATAAKPAVEVKTCSTCPYFDNFHEPNGRGWCQLFDHFSREHHEVTNDCIVSSDLAVSVELEDNLDIFSDIDLEELDVRNAPAGKLWILNPENLRAFPTEEVIDPDDQPRAEYEVGSIVKVIDRDEDHTEWGVFEVTECMYNKNLYDSTENYLNQAEWYYRLSSYQDGNTMPLCEAVSFRADNHGIDKLLWVG